MIRYQIRQSWLVSIFLITHYSKITPQFHSRVQFHKLTLCPYSEHTELSIRSATFCKVLNRLQVLQTASGSYSVCVSDTFLETFLRLIVYRLAYPRATSGPWMEFVQKLRVTVPVHTTRNITFIYV